MRRIVYGVVATAFAASACQQQEPQPADVPPAEVRAPAQTQPAPTVAGPAGTAAIPGARPDVEIPLLSLNNSGVTGEAELDAEGRQRERTEVDVELIGTPGSRFRGHIARGSCENAASAQVVHRLESVTIDDDGDGDRETHLNVPLASLRDGQHIIVFFPDGGSAQQPVACGAIPLSAAR